MVARSHKIHGPLDAMRQPALAGYRWLMTLRAQFGGELLAMLFFSQHVTKGFVRDFAGSAGQYVMQAYHIPASQMGVYGGVINLPWALKPVIGLVSDYCPVRGYAKGPYLVAAAVVGTSALSTLGTLRRALSIEQVVGLGFCVALYASTVDLLTEAQYAKALRKNPAAGPDLISFVWGGMTLAGVLATLASGYVLSVASPWTVYALAAVPASFIIAPALLNWLQEPKLRPEEVAAQRARLCEQKEAIALSAIMLLATLALSWSGMHLSTRLNVCVSLLVMVVVLGCFSVMLNPTIAKVNAFGLIQTSMALSLGGASFYFSMDDAKQYPEGPHFSVRFYSLVLPLFGSFFTLVGIAFYNKTAAHWKYPQMYIVGNLIYCLCSMTDLIFYKRLNRVWGVSDHVFVLGTASFQTVLSTWLWMPSTVIMSQLCPKGMEATMYALLAGCHNLGATISANCGALLLELLAVAPSGNEGETHAFANLWVASLVASLLPTLSIVLVPWFIPNKRQTEAILTHDVEANEGSLLRRWLGLEAAAGTETEGEEEALVGASTVGRVE